jgi:hypothetical protein
MSEFETGYLNPRLESTVLSLVSHQTLLLKELEEKQGELEMLKEFTPDDPHTDVVYDEVSVLREEHACITNWLTTRAS